VRQRVLSKAAEKSKVPLPALTPHSLRRTFCSLLFALGEPHPVVMREMGHTDAKLTLNIYAHVMDRDEKENERLRALVNGESLGRLGTGAQRATPAAIPWFLLRATKPAPRAGSHLMGAAGFEPATSRV
jgi:hypothetical protein